MARMRNKADADATAAAKAPAGGRKRRRKRAAEADPLQRLAKDYWRLWLRNHRAPFPLDAAEAMETDDAAAPPNAEPQAADTDGDRA